MSTVKRGGTVQFVPDTNLTGGNYTDPYGRLLAWLYLDGVPYWNPQEVAP